MKNIFLIFIVSVNIICASQLTKEQKEESKYLYFEYKKQLNNAYLTIENVVYERFNRYIDAFISKNNIKIKNLTSFIELEGKIERDMSPLIKKFMDEKWEKESEVKIMGPLVLAYDKYKQYRNIKREQEPTYSYYFIEKDIKKRDFIADNIKKIKTVMYYNIFTKYLK